MTRQPHTQTISGTAFDTPLAPKNITKEEFGRRLHNLMTERGWHQSELARQSGLPRDSISVYIRGKSLPTRSSLAQLAKALEMSVESLLPGGIKSAVDIEMPTMELRVSQNMQGAAWLRINRLVSVRVALKVMEMLENDNVADQHQDEPK